MKSFVLWQVLVVFIGISGIVIIVPKVLGMQVDATSNFYGSFQNELDAKSVYEIAKQCIKLYGFEKCKEDSVVLENSLGNYKIMKNNKDYLLEISIIHNNPRNLHKIRHFTKKKIKGNET